MEKSRNNLNIESTDGEQPFFDQYETLKPDARAKKFKHTDFADEAIKTEVLEDYLTQFDRMVSVIQGRNEDGEAYAVPYDTVVFMDKSARPLAWMLGELWDDFAEPIKTDSGDMRVPPMPERKFLNIDRLHWRKNLDTEGDFHDISEGDVAALRSIFDVGKHNVLDGTPDKPRRILIVDELSESGDTQRIARDIISQATRDTVVDTFAYMPSVKHETAAGPSYEYPSFPTWYPPKNSDGLHAEDGRGVLDPRITSAEASLERPRQANKFLSSPPRHERDVGPLTTPLLKELEELESGDDTPETIARKHQISHELSRYAVATITRDLKAEKLRRDIKRLGRDFRSGKLFPVVTSDRDEIGGQTADSYYSRRRNKRTTSRPLYK